MAKIKSSRQWDEKEKNLLIDVVETDYSYFFNSLSPSETKQVVDKGWVEIVQKINALSVGSAVFFAERIRHFALSHVKLVLD